MMRSGRTEIYTKDDSKISGQNRCHDSRYINEHELVLWRKPVITLYYFTKELIVQLYTFYTKLYNYRSVILLLSLIILSTISLSYIDGPHQSVVQWFVKEIKWCFYWMGLGILSSVGLGTGLHTFVLYLGPHIASVTLAGYECGSLNFPEPPYPNKILCPKVIDPRWAANILNIMQKVYLEAIMWGAGTAIGELPPYFMARAARLSGNNSLDDDVDELEDLQTNKQNMPRLMTTMDHLKLIVENLIERVGFFGILICASIPNPLFDLAGIMCGHFLVPFWTFFGATLIGKAIIKMTIQKAFIIIAFNETLITKFMAILSHIPIVGKILKSVLFQFLTSQKQKLHGPVENGNNESSTIEKLYERFVIVMVMCFMISIINSFANKYYKRITKQSARKSAQD